MNTPLLIFLPLSAAFVAVVVMALLKSGSDADDAAEEIFERVKDKDVVVRFVANTDEVSAAIDSIARELEQLLYPPTPPRVYRIEPGWWPAVKSNFWRTRVVTENRG